MTITFYDEGNMYKGLMAVMLPSNLRAFFQDIGMYSYVGIKRALLIHDNNYMNSPLMSMAAT